jgi:hypothetical protein
LAGRPRRKIRRHRRLISHARRVLNANAAYNLTNRKRNNERVEFEQLLAFLVVPIELQEKSKEMREVRDFYVTRPLFDEVEKIYDMAKEQLGLPVPVRRKQMQQQEQPAGNAPAANDAPANDPADSAPEGGAPPG